MSLNLKDYICTNPFYYSEIMDDRQTFCCPQWLTEYIEGTDIDYKESWTSTKATNIRTSVLDGSFKYCSSDKCPHLSTLINTGNIPYNSPIKKKVDVNYKLDTQGPKEVKFIFDEACNLACPSCRNTFIRNSDTIYNKSKTKIDKISSAYSNTIEKITMSGSGDPFYSKSFFEFLQNYRKEQFPKLNHIHLHTNAILWNEHNWKKIYKTHNLIKSAEISIDAATKATYEKVRKGGNFDTLLKNLNFISTIDNIDRIIFSFVVQKDNYTEIVEFYNMLNKVFKTRFEQNKILVSYTKILNWGNMSEEEFDSKAVWKTHHPDYKLMKEQITQLLSRNTLDVINNLY